MGNALKDLAQQGVKAAQNNTAVIVQNGDAGKIEDILRGMLPKIAQASLANIPPEYIVSTALTVMRGSEKLRTCDPLSIVHCVVQSAQVGLSLDPVLQQAAMVPRKGKAVFTPMYKGILHLARRSEQIKGVAAQAVYENDFFEYQYGINQSLVHKPPKFGQDRGKIVGWYAYFETYKGGFQFEIMTEAEMQIAKKDALGNSQSDSPWKTDYEPMAKKTILKRVLKLAPAYDRVVQAAILADDLADRNLDQQLDLIDGLVVPTGKYHDDDPQPEQKQLAEPPPVVTHTPLETDAEREVRETKEKIQADADAAKRNVAPENWFALAKSALGACIKTGKQDKAQDWGRAAYERLQKKTITSAQYNELKAMYVAAWPPKPAPQPGLFTDQGNLVPPAPKEAPAPAPAPAAPPVAAPPAKKATRKPKGQSAKEALVAEIEKAEKLSILFTLKSRVAKAVLTDEERAELLAMLNTKSDNMKGKKR